LNYLISGLAKSGTTMLFSRIRQALDANVETFFEPDQQAQLQGILSQGAHRNTLSKVLIGRVTSDEPLLQQFDKHVVIYRDPRDQFVSMLLYLFYDFQVSGDQQGYDKSFAALEKKQQNPARHSAIELYNEVASTVGRAPAVVFENLHRVQEGYIETFAPHKARYEDLLDGHWAELEAYLGLTLDEDAQVPQEYSRVVRSKGYGDWRHWLNADDIAYTNTRWGKSITALGYSLGTAIAQQAISAATTLDYVKQFNPELAKAAR
jgi:hypothetical protein